MIGIQAISTWYPGDEIIVNDLLKGMTLDDQELTFFQSAGITHIHQAAGFTSFDLACGASRRLLADHQLDPGKIDLIIYIKSRLPEHFISSEASRLQHEIKATQAMAHSISDLGCADSSMALKQAADFLTANPDAENVLIAYGCKPYTPNRLRVPVTIHGDGGMAAWITRTSRHRLMDIQFRMEGRYWDLFKVDYRDKVFQDFTEDCLDYRVYGFDLAIESRNRFQEMNESLLQRNELDKKDIRHYLLQNISVRAFEYYESALDIQFSPVCRYNLSRYGHLGPADILQNLLTGTDNGIFNKGELIMIMNNSPAAMWSSMLVEC
jgi:3-oxoacyl-[acyl-carrier-protein] synthase-3